MSYNYDSIPTDTRIVIDDVLNLNDNNKNAIGRLWKLYLRVNHGDTEYAEQDLQNFVNELHNRSQESMLNAINQKIAHIQQEEGITAFGLKKSKKGKTGKKRKRGPMKTSMKKRKRRKTIKGGKDITTYSLNQPSLYNGNTQQELAMRRQQQLEMMRRQPQQQQAIGRQVPIQADPDGLRRQQQDIGRFFNGLR